MKVLLIFALFGLRSLPVYGQYIDDHSRTATDSIKGDVFIPNPAAIFPGKTWISYMQATTTNSYTAVANNNGTTDKRDYDIKHHNHGFGLLYPLGGGAAFGIIGQQVDRDLKLITESRNQEMEEQFRSKHVSARFILDITAKLRGGFAYRVTEEKVNVLGNIFINENDRTKYTGKMNGYALGLFYEDSRFGLGIGHAPNVRGKADVQGEEKIVSHRGFTDVDWYYLDGKMRYGAVYKKWHYQRDDRAEQAQSLIDQRNMSLNGLDLEQFLFNTEMILLGVDYPINAQMLLTATIGRKKSIFLFEGENVPGDNPDIEIPFTHYLARVGLSYEKNDYKFSGTYSQEERELEAFRDIEGWFGTGNYDSYKAKENVLMLSISFVN